jgi:hypothetical protein
MAANRFQMALKPGMSAPAIKAGIKFNELPKLFIEADLSVYLSSQPKPLVFELVGEVSPTEANLRA